MRVSWFLLFVLSLPACRSATPQPPQPAAEASVRSDLNDRFLADDLDVDHFVGIFEGESREIATARDGILAALEVEPGERVADIGAGTGLFLRPLADAVGARGRLFEVDISPGFVEHLRGRVAQEGLEQVEVVLCTDRSCGLPPESVDLAFVCDTYHHFEYPRTTLWSIYRALRPGGRLVVVEFDRVPGVSREWILDHIRADKATFRAEIEGAGFVFEEEIPVDGLKENYVLRFRRP